jgi:hypothetical protein
MKSFFASSTDSVSINARKSSRNLIFNLPLSSLAVTPYTLLNPVRKSNVMVLATLLDLSLSTLTPNTFSAFVCNTPIDTGDEAKACCKAAIFFSLL